VILLVAMAWIYVVLMVALVEATSAQGTVLGALFTFVLFGVLPLAVVLYLMASPTRRRLQRARETAANTESAPPASHPPPQDPLN
jgi:predicted membrane channel-forming protein YqfA (hemolysin III family)